MLLMCEKPNTTATEPSYVSLFEQAEHLLERLFINKPAVHLDQIDLIENLQQASQMTLQAVETAEAHDAVKKRVHFGLIIQQDWLNAVDQLSTAVHLLHPVI